MRCLTRTLITAMLSTSLSGCAAAYVVLMTVTPPEGKEPDFTQSQVEEATGIVGAVAVRFGLRSNPNLDSLRRDSAEDDDYPYRIIASYVPDPNGESRHEHVRVTVGVYKDTGRLAVRIAKLPALWRTEFVRRLEEAVTQALLERFPSHRIVVERWPEGPYVFAP